MTLSDYPRRVFAVAIVLTVSMLTSCGREGGGPQTASDPTSTTGAPTSQAVVPTASPTSAAPSCNAAAGLCVDVEAPSAGSTVNEVQPVSGRAFGLGARQLWLVVLAPNGKHYPQQVVKLAADGSFSAVVYFGDSTNGAGQRFALEVAAASAEASREFAAYLSLKSNAGLDVLPPGVELLTVVQLVRSA